MPSSAGANSVAGRCPHLPRVQTNRAYSDRPVSGRTLPQSGLRICVMKSIGSPAYRTMRGRQATENRSSFGSLENFFDTHCYYGSEHDADESGYKKSKSHIRWVWVALLLHIWI